MQQFKQIFFSSSDLSRNHITLLRENIEQSDVYSTCDFAERLTLMFNLQTQHEYFNGATIAMEGVVSKFPLAADREKIIEFHTHLSDGKVQDSSIVHSHID